MKLILHLGEVAVILRPFVPLGNEVSATDASRPGRHF